MRSAAGRPRAAAAGALRFSCLLFRKGNGSRWAGRKAFFPGAAAFFGVLDRGLALDQFIDLFAAGLDAGPAAVAESLFMAGPLNFMCFPLSFM
jgi:hypothetical protein